MEEMVARSKSCGVVTGSFALLFALKKKFIADDRFVAGGRGTGTTGEGDRAPIGRATGQGQGTLGQIRPR